MHGQTNRPDMQARWYHDVESRCVETRRSQTQKSNSMSIPPALPKPELLRREPSNILDPRRSIKPSSPGARRLSFHQQILCTICGSLLFFLVFGEDGANVKNRQIIRSVTVGTAVALNRPMPFIENGKSASKKDPKKTESSSKKSTPQTP